MADRTQWSAMAAAILASQRAKPVGLSIDPSHAKALKRIANSPTSKRSKVKAARKQRQTSR